MIYGQFCCKGDQQKEAVMERFSGLHCLSKEDYFSMILRTQERSDDIEQMRANEVQCRGGKVDFKLE